MSAVTSISYLGFLIAPAALGAVANAAGLRVAFLVVAAIALAMAAGSAVRPRERAAMIGA
jgi:hypothetical protein